MIPCPECGHENNDSAEDCANCGNYLPRPTRNAVDEKAAAELEAMLDRLDLPDEEAAAPPGTRAGRGALATPAEPMPVEPGDVQSGRQSPAIQMARIAVVAVVLVSMFAPWGRDGGVISNGWVFAIWFTLLSCGVLGALYVGLFLYALTIVPAVSRNWVSWVPRDVRAFLPEGTLGAIDARWVFWLSRLALVLWLILGPYFILSTNIRDWPLEITWGAKLFLVAISLANAVEGMNSIRWGRETSDRLWMAIGAVWICLSLVLLPLFVTMTGAEPSPVSRLSTAELLTQYQAGERTFGKESLQAARLSEANLSEADLTKANLTGAGLSGANLRGANLTGTTVTVEQLAQAASLEGATMPDGTVHE